MNQARALIVAQFYRGNSFLVDPSPSPAPLPAPSPAPVPAPAAPLLKKISQAIGVQGTFGGQSDLANIVITYYDDKGVADLIQAEQQLPGLGDMLKRDLIGFSIRRPNAAPNIVNIDVAQALKVYDLANSYGYDALDAILAMEGAPVSSAQAGGNSVVSGGIDSLNITFGVPEEFAKNTSFVNHGIEQDPAGFTIASFGEKTSLGSDGRDLMLAFRSKEVLSGRGADWVIGFDSGTLDGGENNDVVMAIEDHSSIAKPAVTAGGLGRDLIINKTKGGKLWGDVIDSKIDIAETVLRGNTRRYYYETTYDAAGNPTVTRKTLADDTTNSDEFWWTPDTTIMDAQRYDIATFFGIPLAGGVDDGGVIFATSGFMGNLGSETGSVKSTRDRQTRSIPMNSSILCGIALISRRTGLTTSRLEMC